MRQKLLILLMLVLTLSISFPVAISAADPVIAKISVISDQTVKVVGVYNKGNNLGMITVNQNAVLALEPFQYLDEPPDAVGSVWDTGINNYFQNSGADWIWETKRAEDPATFNPNSPLYDADASTHGRVVVFEKTFLIAGTPTKAATLAITADNCYEVWINGHHVARSATAEVANWATSNLHQSSVDTNGWQNVGVYTIPISYLNAKDNNTIVVVAGNEYYGSEDGQGTAYTPSPYSQGNPGGLIFKLDGEYEVSPPNPPLPELPTGILLGLGLLGVGGFILIRGNKLAAFNK
jgi:hypothetical protein